MKTVHMIGHAHLDPVWLWGLPEGVDAAIATARSACDRLDEYPEFVFTGSGSWFHEIVERLDPPLFDRIRRFVDAGRWALVGGMVIEPDCNLPSAESFAKQLETGQGYFRKAFGRATTVGYNIDSFGHAAYLPRFLREGGIDTYTFMRPGAHEMSLPAPFFRWQSPDGHEVLAFRLPTAYNADAADLPGRITATVAAMQEGVDDTMCFYGIGDHGGGPTKRQIEWIAAHAHDYPGVRVVFSGPRACFDAVRPHVARLPVVRSELQHHAVGCYTVERRVKVSMRRAEARLVQAERVLKMTGGPGHAAGRLRRAWRTVLFNQFHDVAGGTCIDRATRRIAADLGAAESAAEDVITDATRAAARADAEPGVHKVVVVNPGPTDFDGFVEHEPWFGGTTVRRAVVRDERGETVESQDVFPRCKIDWPAGLLFRVRVPAGGRRLMRLERAAANEAPKRNAAGLTSLAGPAPALDLGRDASVGGWAFAFDVHEDPTDTWSHSAVNKFPDSLAGRMAWAGEWEPVESGPLRASARRQAVHGNSRLWCTVSASAGEPLVRLRLLVTWAQVRQLLRMKLWPVSGSPIIGRTDLVSGGWLDRPVNALEYPLAGATVAATGADRLAVVAPEVFSLKVDPAAVSLLLVRSPFLAHHDPTPADWRPECPVADQGTHEFEILLWPAAPPDAASRAATLVEHMLRPPIVFDLTG